MESPGYPPDDVRQTLASSNSPRRSSAFGRAGRWSLSLLACAALLWAWPASAAETRADALFEQALRLREEGRLAEACDLFEQSQALEPSPGTLLNVADCQDAQGKPATAYRNFVAAAKLGKAASRPDVVHEAELRAAELLPRLARISLSMPANVKGMSLTWDGVALPLEAIDAPLPVDPGVHSLVISALGFPSRLVPVVVAPGPSYQQIVVPVLTREAPQALVPPTLVPQAASEGTTRPSPQRRPAGEAKSDLPLAFLAGGALFVTAGFMTRAFIVDCDGKTQEECGANGERGTMATIAYALWGAAGVSAGLGLTLAILDDGKPTRPKVSWSSGCTRLHCGTALTGRF